MYDFKKTNGEPGRKDAIPYRGMPIIEADGNVVYASGRDIGNIAAGYVASTHFLGWKTSRFAFDLLESYQKRKPAVEGVGTQSAQKYGYRMGQIELIINFLNHEWKK